MHRSRLYGLFVDAPLDQAERSVEFWAGALGVTPVPGTVDDPYTVLPGVVDGLAVEIQAVDDTPRFHLDIETDNVKAEVRRLCDLGATEVTRNEGWVTLRAPGGHLVCVVPIQSDTFAAHATEWP